MMDMLETTMRYVEMLVKSYNPGQHERLTEERARSFIWFAITTFLIGALLFIVTFLIVSFGFINHLPATLDEVQTFQLSGTIEADHPVTVLEHPSFVIDLSQDATESEHDVLVTHEGIVYPTFLFFGQSYATWDEIRDLKNPTRTRDRLLTGVVLFLLPSIVFWFLLYTSLKLVLIFLCLVVVGRWLPRAFSHRIGTGDVMKIAILAMPSVVLIGFGLSPLAPTELFWWGIVLTSVVFLLGIAMVSDRVAMPRKGKS